MGYIEKRNGKYRARYRDPLGRAHSKTFIRKADADRFILEMETEKQRGNWIDPPKADPPLAEGAEEARARKASGDQRKSLTQRAGAATRDRGARRQPASPL